MRRVLTITVVMDTDDCHVYGMSYPPDGETEDLSMTLAALVSEALARASGGEVGIEAEE